MAALAEGTLLRGGSPGTLQNGSLAGPLRVESVIGRGGFGITYRVWDEDAQKHRAVKECFPLGCEREGDAVRPGDFASAAQLQTFVSGFKTQCRQLLGLKHPHVAQALDYFEANETVYLVMELASGPTLEEYIREAAPLSLPTALHFITQVATGLGALHTAGLLHLDVKPENVLLREAPKLSSAAAGEPEKATEPHLMLVDFDLVRPSSEPDFLTRPLAMAARCGTPGYAPLEQYTQHARLTQSTDIHALAATLYHLLSGQPPAPAVDRAAGMALVPLSTLRPEVPGYLADAVERALAANPAERPADIAAFLTSLEEPAPVPLAPVAATTMTAAPTATVLTTGSPPGATQGLPGGASLQAPILLPGAPPAAGRGATPGQRTVLHQPPSGVHRIVLTTPEPAFPALCCCCAGNANTTYTYKTPGFRWNLPVCDFCARHQQDSRRAGVVTFWGLAISAVIALVGLAISAATSSFWPILLAPAGIILNFSAMSYGALKNSRTEELLHDTCVDASEPVTQVFNGKVHIWRFKNGTVANEFKNLNAAHVV